MDEAMLERLADLVVGFGANVQEDQIVSVSCEPGKEDADPRDRDQRVPARSEVRRRRVVRPVGQARARRARARGDARLRPRLVRRADPRARRPAGRSHRPLRAVGARSARGPRPGPVGQGPPAGRQGVRPGRQRPHDELVDHPVPVAGMGDARLPRPRPRRGARPSSRATSSTCSGSTSPTRSPPGASGWTRSWPSPGASASAASTPCTTRRPAPTSPSGCSPAPPGRRRASRRSTASSTCRTSRARRCSRPPTRCAPKAT